MAQLNGNDRLGRVATGAYAAGSFGTGVFSTVPTILLLYYCTETLKIPAAWAGVIVFIPKIWALFWDPLVGRWSDGTQSRWGRRRPFLLVGAIGVSISFYGLFAAPFAGSLAAALWVAILYFALTTLYSLFAVPYIAIPAELPATAADRSRLVGARMTLAMVGILAGAGLAPFLVDIGGNGRPGYGFMAAILGAACGLAMMAPIKMLAGVEKGENVARPQEKSGSLLTDALAAAKHARFRNLALSYLLLLTATGAFTSATPYLVVRVAGRSNSDIGLAMSALLVATTLSVFLWSAAGRKWGDGRMLKLGVILFGAGIALLSIAAWAELDWPWLLCIYALLGIPFGATQVLPFSLLAHMIHADMAAGSEGMTTGLWTATEKLGLAIGPALTALALAVFPDDLRTGIAAFLVSVPPLLILISLRPLASSQAKGPPGKPLNFDADALA